MGCLIRALAGAALGGRGMGLPLGMVLSWLLSFCVGWEVWGLWGQLFLVWDPLGGGTLIILVWGLGGGAVLPIRGQSGSYPRRPILLPHITIWGGGEEENVFKRKKGPTSETELILIKIWLLTLPLLVSVFLYRCAGSLAETPDTHLTHLRHYLHPLWNRF